MRKIVLLFFSVIFSMNVFSQTPGWQWANRIGGSSGDEGKVLAVDAQGNIYMTGNFTNTVDFDPGPGVFNLTSASSNAYDIFITKFDAAGNFIWAKAFEGMSWDYSTSLALDTTGNGALFIGGNFQQSIDLDPGPGVFTLTSAGQKDIFIAKLDTAGNFIWGKRLGTTINESAVKLAVDVQGSVYITGTFSNTMDFDPGTAVLNLTTAGGDDMFIVKLDGAGNFSWAKRIGGSANDATVPSITNNPAGNGIYFTGTFVQTVDFDPGPGTFFLSPPTSTNANFFICKLDYDGNFGWARGFMALGVASSGFPQAIAIDGSGNILSTGVFTNTIDFNPGPATYTMTNSNGFGGMYGYILSLDMNGNFLWAKNIAGTSVNSYGIAVDRAGDGSIYVCGNFCVTADFDPGPGVFNFTTSSTSNYDSYVVRLSSDGNFIWAQSIEGLSSSELAWSVAVVATGTVCLTGSFSSSSVSLNPFTLSNAGAFDIYLATTNVSSVELPIELLSFTGTARGNAVNLNWATASEINNDYFTVERSRDAQQFTQVGIVDGAGNSSQALNYFFADEHPFKGLSYYRLMQTDFDGTYTYSNTIAVVFGIDDVSIFFNSSASELTIISGKFFNAVEIYSSLWEKVFSTHLSSLITHHSIGVSQLPPGIYFITVTDQAGNKVTRKVVKM